jgi:hypothetical protein
VASAVRVRERTAAVISGALTIELDAPGVPRPSATLARRSAVAFCGKSDALDTRLEPPSPSCARPAGGAVLGLADGAERVAARDLLNSASDSVKS